MKLTILNKEDAQDSEFCSFFGRIEETINCFQDFLTFRKEQNMVIQENVLFKLCYL